MGTFVPGTPKEQQELLHAAGYRDFDDLFSVIPESVYLKSPLPLEEGKSELETEETISRIAEKNKVYRAIFRGAGAYDHYIPAIVKRVTTKETFLTAYTPYQAEISQGVLQSIFEYQTMICALTGMDVSNASVYDGATATAEAAELCVERKKTRVLISASVAPEVRKVVKTYAFGRDTDLQEIPEQRLPDRPGEKEIETALEKEAGEILRRIPKGAAVIAMCVEGKMLSSTDFAAFLQGLQNRGVSHVCFVVGGSFGLHPNVKQAASLRLSMSEMTFPHHLARVMLSEQIYRAFTILNGSQYHK